MSQIPALKFTQSDMNDLLKLQQLFHNRFLNVDLLNQMVSLYVKGVQQFKGQYLFMRTYFLDRMQFVVSRPEVQKMLKTQNGSDPVIQHIRQSSIKITDELEENKNQYPKVQHHHYEHHNHYNDDAYKSKDKGTKIDMQMKVMRQVQANMKNIEHQVNQVDKNYKKTQKMINDIAKDQNTKLEERLAQRKKKLRKRSVGVAVQKFQDEPVPVIAKEELIEAQRELTEAIQRFTMRLTLKQMNEKQLQEEQGRIKMNRVEESEEEENVQQNQFQGRIKTKRETEEESEYW